jgi:hypothetical protein
MRGKYAYDANPDAARFAAPGVKCVIGDCRDMSALPAAGFDIAFVCNFELQRLRPGGRLLILQPNIRYLGSRYWDFYDHLTPLSHQSLREGLLKNGFKVELLIPRLLPYSFKSRLPSAGWMVRLYLKIPILWRLLGKQMFVVAVRPD